MKETEIDDLIRGALSSQDSQRFTAMNVEPSLFELALKTLQGRNRWATVIAVLASIIFITTAAYSMWSFFQTPSDDIKTLIAWAMGFFFSITAVSMMKLWSWMEIQKYSTVREIKRLELQVALLIQSIQEDKQTPQ